MRRGLTVLVVMAVTVALSGCAGMGQESMVNDDAPAGGQTPHADIGVSSINSVAAWGDNEYGQLGNGTTGGISNTPVPVSVLDESDIKALAVGGFHSLALKRDGTVWAWGNNHWGQLGNGTTDDSNTPVQVKDQNDPTGFLTGVQAIDAGIGHSIALKNDGTVVTWGDNGWGQLGDGTDDSSVVGHDVPHPYPVKVKDLNGVDDLTGVEAIAAGAVHSLALLEDGTVAAWGVNDLGQLGEGSNIEFSNTPREVIKLSGVEAIASGLHHSLALLPDGTVKAWGTNFNGELGYGTASKNQFSNTPGTVKNADGTPLDGVKQLAGGADQPGGDDTLAAFSLALKVDGTVAAWGANDQGQLGDGTTTERHAPVKAANLSGIKAIAAGGGHSLALTTSGKVWAWGDNEYGQLGDGTTTDRHAPFQSRAVSGVVAVAAGLYHSLAG
jgi:alpha-tubulin suppressor-like RCC1 family protein